MRPHAIAPARPECAKDAQSRRALAALRKFDDLTRGASFAPAERRRLTASYALEQQEIR